MPDTVAELKCERWPFSDIEAYAPMSRCRQFMETTDALVGGLFKIEWAGAP